MRALTLTQPWASLVAVGAKTIETRSWSTRYRGPLAIHAALNFPQWAVNFAYDPEIIALVGQAVGLPRGYILATCHLSNCLKTEDLRARFGPLLRFGDFSPGRFGFIFTHIQPLAIPIPARGRLGLWEWTP